ncbi:venom acid phosphatase Acph-1-like [Leptopilina heterotoma]|uniref:venom acid phosphatase Acph-1-like n=1 Tax=Leptopilina heterotoma TaxID=63436 RepID=UPI001CA87DF7|nr:venom acid phosphatase Acph-1-like [Leptopilina heterotoma]
MNIFLLICSFLIIGINSDTLKPVMVSVVFRHGHRTPDVRAVYPNDPHKNNTYQPIGYGNLTPQGKDAALKRGQMLRRNYTDLLSATYNPSDFVARSTNKTRTNLTLEYVIAGMYSLSSVEQFPIKNDIHPSDYLYTDYFKCEKYKNTYASVLQSNELKQQVLQFQELFKNVSKCAGRDVSTNLFHIYSLYGHLQAQAALGLDIPKCFKDTFPNGGMKDASFLTLKSLSFTPVLSKLNGGQFLRNITQSMMDFVEGKGKEKMYLYSGHDINVAGFLHSLKIKLTKLPYFCATVVVELYLQNREYFVRILYYPDDSTNFEILKLDNCDELCPLHEFINLTKDAVPTDEDLIC